MLLLFLAKEIFIFFLSFGQGVRTEKYLIRLSKLLDLKGLTVKFLVSKKT
jgi:hypothetical protein